MFDHVSCREATMTTTRSILRESTSFHPSTGSAGEAAACGDAVMPAAPPTPALTGGPRRWSRAESAAVALAGYAAWVQVTGRPGLFWLLLLVPDVTMLAYLAGPRVGAWCYNAVHAFVGPALCVAAGLATHEPRWFATASLWAAHVGADRALGYGLKYDTGFSATSLSAIGRGVR
jgi:hypothetical protein